MHTNFKGDMNKVPYCGRTGIRQHCIKFSRHASQAPGICTSFISATFGVLRAVTLAICVLSDMTPLCVLSRCFGVNLLLPST